MFASVDVVLTEIVEPAEGPAHMVALGAS